MFIHFLYTWWKMSWKNVPYAGCCCCCCAFTLTWHVRFGDMIWRTRQDDGNRKCTRLYRKKNQIQKIVKKKISTQIYGI